MLFQSGGLRTTPKRNFAICSALFQRIGPLVSGLISQTQLVKTAPPPLPTELGRFMEDLRFNKSGHSLGQNAPMVSLTQLSRLYVIWPLPASLASSPNPLWFTQSVLVLLPCSWGLNVPSMLPPQGLCTDCPSTRQGIIFIVFRRKLKRTGWCFLEGAVRQRAAQFHFIEEPWAEVIEQQEGCLWRDEWTHKDKGKQEEN